MPDRDWFKPADTEGDLDDDAEQTVAGTGCREQLRIAVVDVDDIAVGPYELHV